MAAIFFTFLIVQVLVFLKKDNLALAFGFLGLMLLVAMLYHHATTVLQIRL